MRAVVMLVVAGTSLIVVRAACASASTAAPVRQASAVAPVAPATVSLASAAAPITVPTPTPAAGAVAPTETTRKDRLATARRQTLMARAGFSPGVIDGKAGRKTKIAIEHFQESRGLTVSGTLDEPTLAALSSADKLAAGEVWTRLYTITEADSALITGPIPTDWNERAALDLSGYEHMRELLSERGWCSPDLVEILNPGVAVNDLGAGDVVTLPDVTAPALPRLGRVEIDLEEKIVLGFDNEGKIVSLMHCSIARAMEKRPVGELRVKVVATDPEYTFDPKDWPEVQGIERKLRIAPGPRNPVGTAWIGLDKPGYGIHGTVRPQDIGKTGSHGCFRMANWDAVRLAKAIKIGTVVDVRE